MKYKSKTYIKIPGGEIQYGHVTHSVCIWFRGKLYWIRKPR